MRSNTGFFMALALVLVIGIGGIVTFYLRGSPPAEKTVTCRNDWSTISFLINEDKKVLIMNGEQVSLKNIKLFNTTAISAQWQHKSGAGTRFFLDRIAGRLEVETSNNFVDWEKNTFECSAAHKRF